MVFRSRSGFQATEVDEEGSQVFAGVEEGLGRAGTPAEGPSLTTTLCPHAIIHTPRTLVHYFSGSFLIRLHKPW